MGLDPFLGVIYASQPQLVLQSAAQEPAGFSRPASVEAYNGGRAVGRVVGGAVGKAMGRACARWGIRCEGISGRLPLEPLGRRPLPMPIRERAEARGAWG